LLKERQNSESDIEWQDITDERAKYYGNIENRDTVRKGSKLLYEYLNAGWNLSKTNPVSNDTDIDDKLRELQKERYKIQTEKLENNRWLRENARDELILEKILNAIDNLSPLSVPDVLPVRHNNKEYCLAFGDEHYNSEFEIRGLYNEILNAYNPEIFEKRMWNLLNQVVEIIDRENITKLNVFSMGDFTDGLLRVKQLMKLRYGTIEATIKYADFICNWLNKLTNYVNVQYQMVFGNHSELRMLGQPKGTFKDDNTGLYVRFSQICVI